MPPKKKRGKRGKGRGRGNGGGRGGGRGEKGGNQQNNNSNQQKEENNVAEQQPPPKVEEKTKPEEIKATKKTVEQLNAPIGEVSELDIKSMIKELKIVADQDSAAATATTNAAATVKPVLSLEETIGELQKMKDGVAVESAFADGTFRLPSPTEKAVKILLPSEQAHAAAHAADKDVVQHQLEEEERLSNLMQISQHLESETMPPSPTKAKKAKPSIQEIKKDDSGDEQYDDDFETDEAEDVSDEDIVETDEAESVDERVDVSSSRDRYKVALIVAYYLYSEGSITKEEQGRLKNMILTDDPRIEEVVDEFSISNDADSLQDLMLYLATEADDDDEDD